MLTKTLLMFLVFYLFSAQAMIGDGWTPYASSNMNRDPDMHKIMTTGIMSFVTEASQQNAIKSTDWTFQQVNSIDVQVTDSVKYRLNFSLKNPENKQMNVVLIVNKDASTNEIKLLSWKITNSPQRKEIILFPISQYTIENPAEEINPIEGRLRLQAIDMNDQRILKELHVCLEVISNRENIPSLDATAETKITDIYLHLISDGSNFHLITFKAQKGDNITIIKVLYSQTASPEIPVMHSYTVLDHTAKYERIEDRSKINLIFKRLDSSMRLIDPKDFSKANPPFLAAYTTKLYGQTLYYLSVVFLTSDRSVNHYEIWLSSLVNIEELETFEDLQLFGYIKLDISKETKISQGDLTVVTKEKTPIDCSKIPSFMVCSAYPECSSQKFISHASCMPK